MIGVDRTARTDDLVATDDLYGLKTVGNFIPEIWSQEVIAAYKSNLVMTNLTAKRVSAHAEEVSLPVRPLVRPKVEFQQHYVQDPAPIRQGSAPVHDERAEAHTEARPAKPYLLQLRDWLVESTPWQ